MESSTKAGSYTEESQPDIENKTTENSEIGSSENSTKIENEPTTKLSSDSDLIKVSSSEAAVHTNGTSSMEPVDDDRGSFVTVEEDGSMFVRATSDYVESREKGRVEFGDKATTGEEVQFSNKLMFSLD